MSNINNEVLIESSGLKVILQKDPNLTLFEQLNDPTSSTKLLIEYDLTQLINLDPASKKILLYQLDSLVEDIISITYPDECIIEFEDIDDIIDLLKEEEILTESELEELIEQVRKTGNRRLLDPQLKKLIRSKQIRKQMIIKCGTKAFLYPEELKFPVQAPVVKNGKVQKCVYHCGLIVAAYYRANQWKHKHPEYEKIAKKALELYKKLNCEKSVPIKIHINEAEFRDIILVIDELAKIASILT